MAKKTFTKEQIIVAYPVLLKESKLDKIEAVGDKLKVVDALRVMRPVVKAHDEDVETARETLRPEAMTEIQRKIKEGGEVSQMEMVRLTLLNDEYNDALARYARQRAAEEVELDIIALSKECRERLIDGNREWSAEKIMSVIDVLG